MKKLLFIALISLWGCGHRPKGLQHSRSMDSIVVSYYPYKFETPVRKSCNEIAEASSIAKTDCVVYLDSKDFRRIKAFLNQNTLAEYSNECDARIYVKSGSSEICFGTILPTYPDCTDNSIREKEMEIIYLIAWKSGFYNCFDANILMNDNLIEKYGIPADYEYRRAEDNETDVNEVRKFALKKVVLLSKQTE